MSITKSGAIQLIGVYLTRNLSEKDFIDGWPPHSYVAAGASEPVWSIRVPSNESRVGGDRYITISNLTGEILADRVYGD